jgi:hypothetical protein
VVELLLADGRADPAAHDSNALTMAAHGGHENVTRLLLADGRADPAAQYGEAPIWAYPEYLWSRRLRRR